MVKELDCYIVHEYENKLHITHKNNVDGFSKQWLKNSDVWPEKVIVFYEEIQEDVETKLIFIGGM